MNIIREKDLELFNDNIDKIQDEVKKRTWDVLEPTGDEKMKVVNKVIEYVKKNKRKIYGSYSHNKVIMAKNKKDAFLEEMDIPDIDFYSPDPLHDLFEICNMFYDMGYQEVVGREAQHEETYKIFVDDIEACDISYVPRNIYNKIPFIEIEGAIYVHPNWAIIDYLRILTDPMTSWEIKLDKRFKRFYLLQKNYPINKLTNQLDANFKGDKEEKDIRENISKDILKFITDRKSVMVSGVYAYNYYLEKSGMKNYKNTDISTYELISTNYVEDARELFNLLKEKYGNDLTYAEFYPFFQFTDFGVRIFYKEKLICSVYGNNHKCLPYHKVKAMFFEKDKNKKEDGEINLVSFNLLLLHCFINYMYYRTNDNNQQKDIYMLMISHIIQFRNHYLDENKKNIFDASIFSDFVIDCMGQPVSARKEMADRIKENIANNKSAIFQYRPSASKKNEAPQYQFKNSSGNIINNEKNLKL